MISELSNVKQEDANDIVYLFLEKTDMNQNPDNSG